MIHNATTGKPIPDLVAQFNAKLKKSGLTPTDAKQLGIFPARVVHRRQWSGGEHPVARFYYIDPTTGQRMQTKNPKSGVMEDFCRERCLTEPIPDPPPDENGNVTKAIKYYANWGSAPRAYFPTTSGINWAEIVADPAVPLIITEGELKAAAACKAGFPTVALGGVFSFASRAKGIDFLPELEAVVWTGRQVLLGFDTDTNPAAARNVSSAAESFAAKLRERGVASIKRIAIPKIGDEKGALDDFLVHLGTAGPEELQKLIAAAEEIAPGRKKITVEAGDLHIAATEAENALIEANVAIFTRGDDLVLPYLKDHEFEEKGVTFQTKMGAIKRMDGDHLADVLCQIAKFQKWTESQKPSLYTVDPPTKVLRVLLSRAGQWRVPPLAGTVTSPTLRPDGSVLREPGYDPKTRLFHIVDPNLTLPTIPEYPTKGDAEKALKLIADLFEETSLVSDVDRAIAYSGFISAIARGMFVNVPMHAFDSPASGSGKSYVLEIIITAATGRKPAFVNCVDEAETRKHLVGMLLSAVEFVPLDNINGGLKSDLLCQMLTGSFVSFRELSVSNNIETETRALVFANGNGLRIHGDLIRRSIVAMIDTNRSNPETKPYTKNPLLIIMAERGKYIAAAMTIIRAYRCHPNEERLPPLNSFEAWSNNVRSALVWLGCADPTANMGEMRLDDPEHVKLLDFMQHFPESSINKEVSSADISSVICPEAFVQAVKAIAGDPKNLGLINLRWLARWLNARRGSIVSIVVDKDKKTEKTVHRKLTEITGRGGHGGAKLWKVIVVDEKDKEIMPQEPIAIELVGKKTKPTTSRKPAARKGKPSLSIKKGKY